MPDTAKDTSRTSALTVVGKVMKPMLNWLDGVNRASTAKAAGSTAATTSASTGVRKRRDTWASARLPGRARSRA
jgi:hypothetical protein